MENNQMINFYEIMDKKFLNNNDNPNFKYHQIKIPFRGLIVAPSGSGKTNLLINLIKVFSDKKQNKSKLGTFRDVKIFTRNKDEPLYNYLSSLSPQIQIHENDLTKIELDKMDKTQNHLCVFDDLVLNKDQKPMENLYIRCRKMNCSVLYLSQSFFMTPKIIRQNCNYMWILKLGGAREINIILREFALGVNKETLLNIYKYATKQKLIPLMIDMEAPPESRFRKGLFEIIDPNDFR
jgi:hypothetical protein